MPRVLKIFELRWFPFSQTCFPVPHPTGHKNGYKSPNTRLRLNRKLARPNQFTALGNFPSTSADSDHFRPLIEAKELTYLRRAN